jgi:predicted aspartyl protease
MTGRSIWFNLAVMTYIAMVLPEAIAQKEMSIGVRVGEHGRLLVPVSVNGNRECPFLFDTGATTTVLAERFARKTGVIAIRAERVQTFAGAVSISVGRLDSLRIGNHLVEGNEVLTGDLGRLFNLDPEIDGILGQDVLSRFNYLLDRRGRKLEIDEADTLRSALSGTRVSFEKRGGKIYVPAQGGAVRLMLDSGNPYLVLYEDVAARLGLATANYGAESAVGSSIGRRAIRLSRLAAMEIGDSHLRDVEAYLSPRGPGRSEDGFLPLHLFDSIYVNNRENFLIVNPERNR